MELSDYADSARMAEAAGMGLPSFRVSLTRARSRRESGVFFPTDVPEPDIVFGRSPVWKTATLDTWIAARRDGGLRFREDGEVEPNADPSTNGHGPSKKAAKKDPEPTRS
jgi:hypothetical protein